MQTHPRESEILALRDRGLRSYQIATQLGMSSGEVTDILWRAGSTPVRNGITTPVPQANTGLVDELEARAAEALPPKRDTKAAEIDALKFQARGAKADIAELTQQLATREEMIARRDAEIDELKVRLGELAIQLGCKAAEIEQAVEDLIEALTEESERREAAEARITHVERGRFEAVEELLKARREIRLEREQMAGQAVVVEEASMIDAHADPEWSRWMRPSQAADELGRAKSVISRAANSRDGRVSGRELQVRRELTQEERLANPGSRYLVRYALNTEEGAQ